MAFKTPNAHAMARPAILVLAGLAAMLLVSCSAVGPLCSSDEKVKARILKLTPLGCPTNQVLAVINKHHWSKNSESDMTRDVGTTYFYDPPFETDVIAFWVFDNNGRLIEVWVTHTSDSL
jgi:hypothetical protein